jgi:chaperone required for assembly of F1-ATPase
MRDILSAPDDSVSDPVRRAQEQMRIELPKRFYKIVSVAEGEGGFQIHLDGRAARTPGRAAITLPTEAAAKCVADEFAAQIDVINPSTMPTFRLVNTAIDGVAKETEAVAEDVLRFSSSDMLCYRADSPQGLVARQNEAWDPILDWAATEIGAHLVLAEGVIHVAQPPVAIQAVKFHLSKLTDPFRLAGIHLMTSISGSAIVALAVEAGAISPEEAWQAAHIDEDWQIEHWGQDSEAVARRNGRWRDFSAAASLIAALDD